MTDWIPIKTKFASKCVECGEPIDKGSTAYWKKDTGLKHYPECTPGLIEDKSELRIIDDNFEDYLND